MTDLWTWREIDVVVPETTTSSKTNKLTQTDVTGYDVEATDGHIGKVDEATYDVGGSYLVVDTGFWIFGKKRMIPASVVQRVDPSQRKAYLGMSKDEVKNAPDYDADHVFKDQRQNQDDYYSTYGTTPGRRK
jgi:hypothetical protein